MLVLVVTFVVALVMLLVVGMLVTVLVMFGGNDVVGGYDVEVGIQHTNDRRLA